MKKAFVLFVFFCSSKLFSIELMPWTNRELELYPTITALYQHYTKVNSSSKSFHLKADDLFLSLGISSSYFPWSGEASMVVYENLHSGSLNFDQAKLTGRYHWKNDIISDPLSITFGATLIFATKRALRNISSFHAGEVEGEWTISVGRETSYLSEWLCRWWVVGGIGVANHGSPWSFAKISYEKKLQRGWIARVFANSLFGLGKRSLSKNSFSGYGAIAHRSVEIGTRFVKETDDWGFFTIEYAQRVFAKNFPKNVYFARIAYTYPFGL